MGPISRVEKPILERIMGGKGDLRRNNMSYKIDISKGKGTWIGQAQNRCTKRPHSTEAGATFMTGLFWVLVIGLVLVLLTK